MNHKPTGRALSIPKGLAAAGIISAGLTLLGSGVIALLVNTQMMKESNIGYAVMVMLIATSYVSAFAAWRLIKHRRMQVCSLAGCIYFLVLISATAMFFGGQYSSVWETALLILCGSMLAALHGTKPAKTKKYRNTGKAYR